jgi:hypothetical protein
VDGSQTVHGSGTSAFSIFPFSKLVDLDRNNTRDLVRLRGHGRGGPKLSCAAVLSRRCWRQNPSTKRKWKRVEAPRLRIGLI